MPEYMWQFQYVHLMGCLNVLKVISLSQIIDFRTDTLQRITLPPLLSHSIVHQSVTHRCDDFAPLRSPSTSWRAVTWNAFKTSFVKLLLDSTSMDQRWHAQHWSDETSHLIHNSLHDFANLVRSACGDLFDGTSFKAAAPLHHIPITMLPWRSSGAVSSASDWISWRASSIGHLDKIGPPTVVPPRSRGTCEPPSPGPVK